MEGRPIRVALLGAGFIAHGLANHIVNTTPGMRVVGSLQPPATARIRSLPICRTQRRRLAVSAT